MNIHVYSMLQYINVVLNRFEVLCLIVGQLDYYRWWLYYINLILFNWIYFFLIIAFNTYIYIYTIFWIRYWKELEMSALMKYGKQRKKTESLSHNLTGGLIHYFSLANVIATLTVILLINQNWFILVLLLLAIQNL